MTADDISHKDSLLTDTPFDAMMDDGDAFDTDDDTTDGQADGAVHSYTVQAADVGVRLDKLASTVFDGFSRANIQKFIDNGELLVNGAIVKPKYAVKAGDALALTAGKVLAALADDGVKTVGQRLDPRGQPGVLDSAGELLVRKILPQADVIAQGVVKKHSLLRDIADTPIEGGAVDIPHLLPVEADVPGVAGVILEQ